MYHGTDPNIIIMIMMKHTLEGNKVEQLPDKIYENVGIRITITIRCCFINSTCIEAG